MSDAKKGQQFSPQDRHRAEALYVCFDRPAFRQNFEAHTDIVGLMQAVDDTIAAINTGTLKQRDCVRFGPEINGRAYFESDYLREAFGKNVDLLSKVKDVYRNAYTSGYFFDLASIGRSGLAFHSQHLDEAIGVAVVIDDLRNQVLTIANDIYGHFGLTPFPHIATPEHYRKLASRFKTVTDILQVRPGIFGVSVDIGKLLQKLFRIK